MGTTSAIDDVCDSLCGVWKVIKNWQRHSPLFGVFTNWYDDVEFFYGVYFAGDSGNRTEG